VIEMKNNFINNITKFFRNINRRSLKYGSVSFALIASVAAIAVLVNVVLGLVIDKFNVPLKWDLTPNKLYSITDTTKNILRDLKKDVEITGLFDDQKMDEYKDVVELLNHYTKNPHIKVRFIDPDRNPGVIKDFDPDGRLELSKYDFIVRSGNKVKKLGYYDLYSFEFNQQTFSSQKTGINAEQGFTGAIKYVTSDFTPVVYFLEGHGEGSLESDFRSIKGYLEKNNFDVKTLNLLTQDKVPEDAEMIVAASPKSDLASQEADRLSEYLKAGGKALFMIDSLKTDPDLSNFEEVMRPFNLGLNYDIVKESNPDRHFPNNPYALVLDVKSSDIISKGFQMVLANSRSVKILRNDKEYIKVTSLIQTSDKAEGEQIDSSRGSNIPGPLDIAVASINKGQAKEARMAVIGNSEFISDRAQQMYGQFFERGSIFFLNTLGWLLDQKDENIIAPKIYTVERLNVTAGQVSGIGFLTVILFPVIILGAGVAIYLRRRHL